MQIKFNVNLDNGEAKISPATADALSQLSPLMQADLLKDVIFDATQAYTAALEAMAVEFEAIRHRKNGGKLQ